MFSISLHNIQCCTKANTSPVMIVFISIYSLSSHDSYRMFELYLCTFAFYIHPSETILYLTMLFSIQQINLISLLCGWKKRLKLAFIPKCNIFFLYGTLDLFHSTHLSFVLNFFSAQAVTNLTTDHSHKKGPTMLNGNNGFVICEQNHCWPTATWTIMKMMNTVCITINVGFGNPTESAILF